MKLLFFAVSPSLAEDGVTARAAFAFPANERVNEATGPTCCLPAAEVLTRAVAAWVKPICHCQRRE